jgi:hypothetical protein
MGSEPESRQGLDDEAPETEIVRGAVQTSRQKGVIGICGYRISCEQPRQLLMTPTDIGVYRHAVRHRRIDPMAAIPELDLSGGEVATVCKRLLQLQLLSRAPDRDELVPVHPDLARQRLNEPLAIEIKSRERVIDDNNQLFKHVAELLAETHEQGSAPAGIDVIRDPAQARREMERAAQHCADEALTTHLGTQADADQLERAGETDVAMLSRGVNRRMIYQHISRSSLGMRSFIKTLARHGGQVRTTSESFEKMTIFDRRMAFIPFEPSEGGPAGVVVITHEAVVRFLYRGFWRLWSGAMPFGDEETTHELASADNRMLLLRLLASGLKDEAIANRLGIATRTCRRYIAELLEELGVASRFQAGLKIGQLGLLPIESSLSTDVTAWVDAHPLS